MKKYIFLTILLVTIVILLIIGNKSISTEIVIDTSAENIWKELTNFEKYPEWNPFIRKVSGNIAVGSKIEVTLQTDGNNPIVFTPIIQEINNNRIFQWKGQLLMPGIFTGKHTFQLLAIDKNQTKLIQKEEFNGILVSFFNFDSTIKGFGLMNKSIKERVEK
jgi:hypothetical protein